MMPRAQYYTPFRIASFVLVLAVGLTLVQVPIDAAQEFPREGQLAEETLLANEDLRFDSDLLTDQAREAAAADVPVQLTFDAGVRTAQVAALANYLAAADEVLAEVLLEGDERAEALAALPDSQASRRTQVLILGFMESQWNRVKTRSIELLTELLTENITAKSQACEPVRTTPWALDSRPRSAKRSWISLATSSSPTSARTSRPRRSLARRRATPWPRLSAASPKARS